MSTGPERCSISVHHRFMHIAHDSYMSKVRADVQPAAYQSGLYMSRLSFHLGLNVVYVHVSMSKVDVFCDHLKHSDC